jgi:hypothetical protein
MQRRSKIPAECNSASSRGLPMSLTIDREAAKPASFIQLRNDSPGAPDAQLPMQVSAATARFRDSMPAKFRWR